jgi:hypothetical protein
MLSALLLLSTAASAYDSSKVQFVQRNPYHQHVMGIPELSPPISHGYEKKISHSVTWEHPIMPGKKVQLEYEAELHPDHDIVSLDLQKEFAGMYCNDGGEIHLLLNNSHELSGIKKRLFSSGAVITASPAWQCVYDDHEQSSAEVTKSTATIIRQVTQILHSEGDYIVLKSVPLHFSNLFKHLNMTMKTSVFPNVIVDDSGYTAIHDELSPNVMSAARKPNGFFSKVRALAQRAWSDVKTVASDVAAAVGTVAVVVSTAFTGSLDLDHSYPMGSVSWNYNPSTQSASQANLAFGDGVSCSNCYADFDVTLVATLQVSNYNLQTMETYIQGNMVQNIDLVFSESYAKDVTQDFILTTIQMPGLTVRLLFVCLWSYIFLT